MLREEGFQLRVHAVTTPDTDALFLSEFAPLDILILVATIGQYPWVYSGMKIQTNTGTKYLFVQDLYLNHVIPAEKNNFIFIFSFKEAIVNPIF